MEDHDRDQGASGVSTRAEEFPRDRLSWAPVASTRHPQSDSHGRVIGIPVSGSVRPGDPPRIIGGGRTTEEAIGIVRDVLRTRSAILRR